MKVSSEQEVKRDERRHYRSAHILDKDKKQDKQEKENDDKKKRSAGKM
jgi:hypothetical protein